MNALEAAKLAKEANLTSQNSQYQEIMRKIEVAAKGGKYQINVDSIIPDVKDQLILEGFKVDPHYGGDRDSVESWVTIQWPQNK